MAKATLADLKAFCAIARLRSFGRAADMLGVSRSSLSHAMRSLEADLGVRILHRTTRSVSPTEAGERLLKRLTPVLHELDEALDAIGDHSGQPAGTLRINGNEAAIRLLLETVVPHFLSRYPRMAIDLVADGRLVDIVEEGFDAGVRLAEAVPQDMIAIPLGPEVRFVAVAAPGYLADRDPPFSPDDLKRHICIRQRLPSGKPYRWEFERQNQQIVIDVPGALTLNSVGLTVEAAANGLGIAYVPESAAQKFLRDGRLTKLLDDWSPLIPGLRLYYPGRRHVPVGLRALVDLLKELQSTAAGELMTFET
jgi:DNA-binding transcriptional LysR family regulator